MVRYPTWNRAFDACNEYGMLIGVSKWKREEVDKLSTAPKAVAKVVPGESEDVKHRPRVGKVADTDLKKCVLHCTC